MLRREHTRLYIMEGQCTTQHLSFLHCSIDDCVHFLLLLIRVEHCPQSPCAEALTSIVPVFRDRALRELRVK